MSTHKGSVKSMFTSDGTSAMDAESIKNKSSFCTIPVGHILNDQIKNAIDEFIVAKKMCTIS